MDDCSGGNENPDVPTRDMRTFRCYRPSPPASYYETGAANPPNEPQFEGVIFSDGTVVLRWLTEHRSHSVWTDWKSMSSIHGHPEYGTVITFDDGGDAPE